MKPILIVGLILLIFVYLLVLFLVFKARRQKDAVVEQIIYRDRKSGSFVFNIERKLLDRLNIPPEKAGGLLWTERIILVILAAGALVVLRGLGFALVCAVIVTLVFEDLYNRQLYDSGVTSISRVTNFLNFFVPHITSGNSADQSMLEYIEYAGDQELADCYEQRGQSDTAVPSHYRLIFEIYDIAKYNEEKGINDYTYILNDISSDLSQKQEYYNKYISRIGEIKPIEWSYYIGVPALIIVSYGQTYSFWQGLGGVIVGFVLAALFTAFKFLIFKLKAKTIRTIF